jgi:hypothetical protein
MAQNNEKGSDESAHGTGTGKGEEMKGPGGEPGRHEKGESGKDRPAGGSTARDSTSINPEDRNPIHPDMPNFPPP